ncbi:hypothetical protein ACHQM5_013297 [Ranunculus cassubicifolius]
MEVELPEHVLLLILVWLPVKSLLRFKVVCKYWYSLIQSSSFINQHLRHQHDNVNCSLIVRKPNDNIIGSRFFMLTGYKFDESSVCLDFANKELRSYSIHVQELIDKLQVANACNGIICLYKVHEDVALWNPATRHLRPLPPPKFPVSRPPQSEIMCYPFLGFDPKTNDYKVVKIIFSAHRNTPDLETQVEVYNLSTDAWRITHTDYILPFFPYNDSLYYKGISFFYGDNQYPQESKWSWLWVLISFDFGTETFRFIPMPNVSGVSTLSLDFLDDSLICFNHSASPVKPSNSNFDIWVLHGYGIKESWTKLYSIGPFDFVIPKKFMKQREFLLLCKNLKLCLYNLVTQEMHELYKVSTVHRSFATYNESLVSIKGENDGANRAISLV